MSNKILWFGPEVSDPEVDAITKVLRSGYINDGEVTKEFEKQIASFLGIKHCVAVTSGTAAITLALIGLGIGPGSEVIVPDLTFIATANAVRLAGATPILADIEPDRFNIDVGAVERAITPRTKAIVPVDVNGRGAAYEDLLSLAKAHRLHIVCDAAEGFGSKYKNQYLGTFGDAGCFSFSPNKTITTGQGGAIVTNNTELYHHLCELKDQGRRVTGSGGDDLHPVLGFNFKFTNLQAALGIAQMQRVASRLLHFQQRDAWYLTHLADCPNIQLSTMDSEGGEVRQWADVLTPYKKKLAAELDKHNIGYRAFWFPLHRQAPYQQPDKNFPNAIAVSQQGLWLPSSFQLSEKDVMRCSYVIRQTCQSAIECNQLF